jgi:hypothetical protein
MWSQLSYASKGIESLAFDSAKGTTEHLGGGRLGLIQIKAHEENGSLTGWQHTQDMGQKFSVFN